MKKAVRIVARYDKKNSTISLIAMFVMIIFMTILLLFFKESTFRLFTNIPIIDHAIVRVTRFFLYFGIIFFSLCIGLAVYLLYSTDAVLVLYENGIWIKHHNFISWNNIEEIDSYTIVSSMKAIGIKIKDVDLIYKQSSVSGKLNLFWAKLFKRYYQITLSNLDISNDDLLQAYRKFRV